MVHNETSTGLTYPAREVGEIARRHGALYLLDTVSALAGLDVQTDAWSVDVNMTGSQKCLAMPLASRSCRSRRAPSRRWSGARRRP
jgi:aspartate aminotransferase-like enzyme